MSIGQMGNKKACGFKNALGYKHTKESLEKIRKASRATWQKKREAGGQGMLPFEEAA